MNLARGTAIFCDIGSGIHELSEKFKLTEIGEAIYLTLDMPTHNGFGKKMILGVIKWLFGLIGDIEEANGIPTLSRMRGTIKHIRNGEISKKEKSMAIKKLITDCNDLGPIQRDTLLDVARYLWEQSFELNAEGSIWSKY